MVPLIIQLGLIAKFTELYVESERALASSERYGEVTETLVQVDAHLFRLIEAFYGYKLNLANAEKTHSMVEAVSQDLDAPIAKLQELAKDDPESLTILNRLLEVRKVMGDTIETFAKQLIAGVSGLERAVAVRQFAVVARKTIIALPEMESALQKLAYTKREEGKRLKDQERSMIVTFAIIDFGFAVLATFALLNSTSYKLRKLRSNVDRYAFDQPLLPPSDGQDEIDVIDRAFFDTASQLQVLHRKERALIYESQDPIVFLNQKGGITFLNLTASSLFREAGNFLDYVKASEQKQVEAFLLDVGKGRERKSLEIELQLKRIHHVILSAVLEPNENSILCIIHDITERYEVESIRQEIVSMFTHDLRNPLTSVNLALESLTEKPELANYEKTLKRAQTNIAKMSSLINDLLDLYKTEAGLMHFEQNNFSALALCDGALEEVVDIANHLNVKLQRVPSTDVTVKADYKSSLRILVNLLSNAIKHSPAGGVVTVKVHPQNNLVAFEVADAGPGIPIEEQPHVFNRFQQASTSKNSRLGGVGSGLGLAICRAFAERQGGRMSLVSEVGVGSAFTCSLPGMQT